jgi:hypothetical protein
MPSARNTNDAYAYQRRRPEKALRYRTIETYWPMFVIEQARVGKKLPHFIHKEFDDYLRCGIPELGSVKTYFIFLL